METYINVHMEIRYPTALIGPHISTLLVSFVFLPCSRMTKRLKLRGAALTQNESQKGRKFNDTYRVYRCICKESKK